MQGRSAADVEKNTALYRSLYQAQLDLDAQSSCPQGHPFSDGFHAEDGQVVEVKVTVNVTPKGRVTCRICDAQRQREARTNGRS